MEAGDIADGATLRGWLATCWRTAAGRADAILLRHAHRAAGDAAALDELAALARAAQPARERLAETLGQGNAFVLAAAPWGAQRRSPGSATCPTRSPSARWPGAHGIAEDDAACAGYLQAFAANLVSAAVRLVPLGQTAGLRVLAALEPAILAVAASNARRHARRSRRRRLPGRPRRHAPRNPVHEAVPVMNILRTARCASASAARSAPARPR